MHVYIYTHIYIIESIYIHVYIRPRSSADQHVVVDVVVHWHCESIFNLTFRNSQEIAGLAYKLGLAHHDDAEQNEEEEEEEEEAYEEDDFEEDEDEEEEAVYRALEALTPSQRSALANVHIYTYIYYIYTYTYIYIYIHIYIYIYNCA